MKDEEMSKVVRGQHMKVLEVEMSSRRGQRSLVSEFFEGHWSLVHYALK